MLCVFKYSLRLHGSNNFSRVIMNTSHCHPYSLVKLGIGNTVFPIRDECDMNIYRNDILLYVTVLKHAGHDIIMYQFRFTLSM